jgi:hypothetical protein
VKVRLHIEGLGDGWLTDEHTVSDWGQPAFLREQDGQIHSLEDLPMGVKAGRSQGVEYTEVEIEWVRLWLPVK